MKELVEVIAKNLVEHPEEVVVTEKEEGKHIVVELHVAASDMGKVRKAGQNCQSNPCGCKSCIIKGKQESRRRNCLKRKRVFFGTPSLLYL